MLKLVLIVLALVGGALLLRLHLITAGSEQGLDVFYNQSIHIVDQVANFLRLQDATPNYSRVKQVIDILSGSASLAYCLLFWVLIAVTGKPFKTPANKLSFFIFLNLGWLALIPSNYYNYLYRSIRFDYPMNADSIIIPIFSGTISILITLPVINAIFYMLLFKAPLPVNLFVRFHQYSAFSIIAEIFFAMVLLFLLFILVNLVQYGDVTGIPILMLLLYLFISSRAAHAAKSFQQATSDQN